MNIETENQIWEGVFPANLLRLVKYYEEYKSLNPREADIYARYINYKNATTEDEKRWRFWPLVNACAALDTIERWSSDKTAFPNDPTP